MNAVTNFINCIVVFCVSLVDNFKSRAIKATTGEDGEAYVDTGVKILIAVVIGALLLALCYALFNDTLMPSVTQKVQDLFNYAG